KNALDAAVLAYNNVSLLRQQIKPTHRVHGIFEGKIGHQSVRLSLCGWLVRAPTTSEMEDIRKRVVCLAAALASGCNVQITIRSVGNEIRQNKALGDELADVVLKRYGAINYDWGIKSASTDFVILCA
ncbi:hypothetical protein BD769DRAFT_1360796, partial [Suillus cothurnatus]